MKVINIKKILNNKKNKIIICISIFVFIFGLLVNVFIHNNKNSVEAKTPYVISDKQEEIEGTIVYTNDQLSSSHCLNGICIENATFYYLDEEGRVDYIISNNTTNEKTGYLKMKVEQGYLLIAYQKLGALSSVKTTSRFKGFDLSKTVDYSLEELSDQELVLISE